MSRIISKPTAAALSVALAIASACAHGGPVAAAIAPAPAAHAASARELPNDIRWFRVSAEYRALARQAYQVASDRLPELSRGLAPRSWAVILDADETVLDNSEYERRRSMLDSAYTDASWARWVNEAAATAIPGAPELTRRVHELGGRVAIVTNRADSLCAPTRENLQRAGIAADVVLCQAPGVSDKNPRFEALQRGTAVRGLPPLAIVAWFGDNILDFPRMNQETRHDPGALAEFGRRYFILPNPMYGSWQQNREP